MTNPTSSEPIRDGNVWVFPDGRTLPVISGGSDEGLAAPAEAAPAVEAPAAAPASAPEPAPAETAGTTAEPSALDTEFGDSDAVVSRGWAEKIKKEGQTYRERAQEYEAKLAEYEQVYGQYEAEDRQAWFEMANRWAEDPRSGAEMMQRIADAVLNEGKTPEEATEQVIAEDQIAAEADAAGVAMTPEQIQALVDERFAAQKAEEAQEAAIQGVFAEITAAGFDPQSRDGHSILWTANNETQGDIAKAIEIVKADKQKIIDEYVASKSAPSARTAPSDGMLAQPIPEVGGLDDAFKSANAWLKAQTSQPG